MSTVDVFSQDTGMEFGTKKCGMIIMNKGKVKSTSKCICKFKVFFKLVFIAAQAFERTFFVIELSLLRFILRKGW